MAAAVDLPGKALWRACDRSSLEDVRSLLLLHPNLDVNWPNFECYDFTPLHIACTRGDPRVLIELLRHPKINVNRLDANDMTPFMLSCQVGRVKPLKVMLADHRTDVTVVTPRGSTGLWFASCFGKSRAVMAIFASGCHINLAIKGKHYDGRMLTPAGIAAANKQHELARLLEQFEENPEKTSFESKMGLAQRGAVHFISIQKKKKFHCRSFSQSSFLFLPLSQSACQPTSLPWWCSKATSSCASNPLSRQVEFRRMSATHGGFSRAR